MPSIESFRADYMAMPDADLAAALKAARAIAARSRGRDRDYDLEIVDLIKDVMRQRKRKPMKHGKRIWCEDDATPGTEGHETVGLAWQRLFGEPFDPKQAVEKEDCGDGDMLRMPNGKVVWSSYPGNDAIYEPE